MRISDPQRTAHVMAVPHVHGDQHVTPWIAPSYLEQLVRQVLDMRSPRAPCRPSGKRRDSFIEQIGDEVAWPALTASDPGAVR